LATINHPWYYFFGPFIGQNVVIWLLVWWLGLAIDAPAAIELKDIVAEWLNPIANGFWQTRMGIWLVKRRQR
jgi:hypothetical protein